MMKSYMELSNLRTFDERFEYCKQSSPIGLATFGGSRYLNQAFYSSSAWKEAREYVIIRDNGCDLGIPDYPIASTERGVIHHLNPITREQVINRDPILTDPNNLILCKHTTHNLLHFSGDCPKSHDPVERSPHDTSPWKRSL